jgi:hypothetical protein
VYDEDAVEIKFYYDWNREEGNDYYIVPLCEGCADERGGDVGEAGDPDPGTAWRCEDCDNPNQAKSGSYSAF